MGKVLLVVDLQRDYFDGGKFPLWNAEPVLQKVLTAIEKAQNAKIPVVLIQHVAKPTAPFFCEGSQGVEIHPRILTAAPDAPIVTKEFADAFVNTSLETVLNSYGASELLVCGMMSHNCVTHTAISKSAEKYKVSILGDSCTTVSEILHIIALRAVATRLPVETVDDAL